MSSTENKDTNFNPVVRLKDIKPKLSTGRRSKRKLSEMDDEKTSSLNGDARCDNSSSVLPGMLTPRSTPSPSTVESNDEDKRKKRRSETSEEGKSEQDYEVEEIVGYHIDNESEIWYLIKWKGYSKKYNTWEQIENLTDCNQLLMDYFGAIKPSQRELKAMEEEITSSLENYSAFQKLKDSDYLKKYLDEFSDDCLDLQPLFKCKSIDSFVAEMKKQYSYVLRTLIGMYNHRDWRMFKRGQNYKVCLKICELRKQQLEQLLDVEKKINGLEKCSITIENTVDLEHFPKDLEYITETRLGKDVQVPTDPVIGCDCRNGCSTKSRCCGNMSESEFAYNAHGKLRLPDHSAIYECNSRCSCKQDCPNRIVQNGRKIKLAIFKTKSCGWGVKALEKIPKGTFVCEYVGELIKDSEAVVRDISYVKQGISYLFDLDFNDVEDENLLHCIDATTCGNVARFINHSCDPNLIVFPVWINCLDPNLPRLAFFSKRQIQKNEEIHFDYESIAEVEDLPEEDDKKKKLRAISKIKCECKSAKCREWVFGNK